MRIASAASMAVAVAIGLAAVAMCGEQAADNTSPKSLNIFEAFEQVKKASGVECDVFFEKLATPGEEESHLMNRLRENRTELDLRDCSFFEGVDRICDGFGLRYNYFVNRIGVGKKMGAVFSLRKEARREIATAYFPLGKLMLSPTDHADANGRWDQPGKKDTVFLVFRSRPDRGFVGASIDEMECEYADATADDPSRAEDWWKPDRGDLSLDDRHVTAPVSFGQMILCEVPAKSVVAERSLNLNRPRAKLRLFTVKRFEELVLPCAEGSAATIGGADGKITMKIAKMTKEKPDDGGWNDNVDSVRLKVEIRREGSTDFGCWFFEEDETVFWLTDEETPDKEYAQRGRDGRGRTFKVPQGHGPLKLHCLIPTELEVLRMSVDWTDLRTRVAKSAK